MKYAPYRRAEALKATKRNHFPKRFLFLDTETTPRPITPKSWINCLKLGVAIYVELDKDANVKKRIIHQFKSVYEFLGIIAAHSQKKSRILCIGHNVAFDIEVLNLADIFTDLGCECDYPIRNGKTFLWRVELNRGSLLFLDTANYSATSLERLGEDIGIPKRKIDFDTCTDFQLLKYCLNDVKICEKFILEYIRFLLHNNMGEFKETIASQALTSYRYRFMKTAPVFHINDKVNEIEKYSYFGGRTEALRLGDLSGQTWYNLDVSSEYPAAMIKTKMPYQLIGVNSKIVSVAFKHHLDHAYLIVDCTVETELPVFPVRAKIRQSGGYLTIEILSNYAPNQNGYKIIYPVGTYRTWLHHSEFIYAYERDLIKEIHGYVVYRAEDLFIDYVKTLYELKAQYAELGNESFRYMTKILLNALYGKWAQEYHVTELIAEIPDKRVSVTYGYSDRGSFSFTEINWFGKVYRTYQTGLSTYSFPAIAGAITSNARMILWEYREIAGHENVVYSDTDSLLTNVNGYEALKSHIAKGKLGKLELKGSSERLIIYGNKDYEFGSKITHKGIPSKARETEPWQWEYMHFEGFNEWRNNGANRAPIMERVIKTRKSLYDKGLLCPNGLILPFRLERSVSVYEVPLPVSPQVFREFYAAILPVSSLIQGGSSLAVG